MNVAFGADGRDISMIGNDARMDSCIGAPVMRFVSTSCITTKSLSCCCIIIINFNIQSKHYDTESIIIIYTYASTPLISRYDKCQWISLIIHQSRTVGKCDHISVYVCSQDLGLSMECHTSDEILYGESESDITSVLWQAGTPTSL